MKPSHTCFAICCCCYYCRALLTPESGPVELNAPCRLGRALQLTAVAQTPQVLLQPQQRAADPRTDCCCQSDPLQAVASLKVMPMTSQGGQITKACRTNVAMEAPHKQFVYSPISSVVPCNVDSLKITLACVCSCSSAAVCAVDACCCCAVAAVSVHSARDGHSLQLQPE
jgi:hypothetical protein